MEDSMGACSFGRVVCTHIRSEANVRQSLHCLVGKDILQLKSFFSPRILGKYLLSLEISGRGSGNVG